MRADRLLKLADFLETVPRKAFDIASWKTRAASKPEGKRPGDCGFAGCAVGWAAHAKLFREFKLNGDCPVYRGLTSFEAVDRLFDFSEPALFDYASGESKKLFVSEAYPGSRPTPKQVAKRIRKFVSDHQAQA